MTNNFTNEIEIERRWQEFQQDVRIDDAGPVRALLHWLAEALPFVVDHDGARKVVETLYGTAGIDASAWSEGLGERISWMDADEELPIEQLTKLPICKKYLSLKAYGLFGLFLPADTDGFARPNFESGRLKPGHVNIAIQEMLTPFEERLLPQEWAPGIEQVLNAALARWAIDFGGNDIGVSVEELAAIAQTDVKTVKNELSPSSKSELRLNNDEKVDSGLAERWLLGRRRFRSSIWREDIKGLTSTPNPKKAPEPLADILFVPVTRSGEHFSPDHNKDGIYRIGPKGHEQVATNYRDALHLLVRLREPQWQRPDSRQYLRTATGIGWKRVTAEELGLEKGDAT